MAMTDCIYSQIKTDSNGYATKYFDGVYRGLHRVSWEILNGPIPKGMLIDHTCHNEALEEGTCKGGRTCKHRACINPAHLRLTSHLENVQAGARPLANNEFCKNGHAVSDNLRHRPNGRVYCLSCRQESNKQSMARKKERDAKWL